MPVGKTKLIGNTNKHGNKDDDSWGWPATRNEKENWRGLECILLAGQHYARQKWTNDTEEESLMIVCSQ